MSITTKVFSRSVYNSVIKSRITFCSSSKINSVIQKYSTESTAKPILNDAPPKYTTSKAAKWKASESFQGPASDVPWYQPHIVIMSTAIFLIYFCVLREENDIDEQLYRPLFETVPAVEKPHLITTINSLKSQGKDYSQYEKRLKELEAKM